MPRGTVIDVNAEDVGHSEPTNDPELLRRVEKLTIEQLEKMLTDAKYNTHDPKGSKDRHTNLVNLVKNNFSDSELRSMLPTGGRRGHTRRRHGRRHRRGRSRGRTSRA
jgi:hypothetical protein